MDNSGFDPTDYWQRRYQAGGTSGAGSRGRLADFKAAVVNALVAANSIDSIIDLGCGDGVQMAMLGAKGQTGSGRSDPHYLGVDVSPEALALCRALAGVNPRRRFIGWADFVAQQPNHTADLALSMDVIYHLTDDNVFQDYLDHLFGCARRFVLIYASNIDARTPDIHVRHRRFTDQIRQYHPAWRLAALLPNRFGFDQSRPNETSFADFHVYTPLNEGVVVTVPPT
ncbi:MAG: class I SAM-dependent methyltransferase [Acidiphilium sp.]|nr:class I SAM-dependent methyltransferase [Acidiphilium sp.]MDD4934560.1 class I SAM-dependent methyltransferase [Acidiphilium sp.]